MIERARGTAVESRGRLRLRDLDARQEVVSALRGARGAAWWATECEEMEARVMYGTGDGREPVGFLQATRRVEGRRW